MIRERTMLLAAENKRSGIRGKLDLTSEKAWSVASHRAMHCDLDFCNGSVCIQFVFELICTSQTEPENSNLSRHISYISCLFILGVFLVKLRFKESF